MQHPPSLVVRKQRGANVRLRASSLRRRESLKDKVLNKVKGTILIRPQLIDRRATSASVPNTVQLEQHLRCLSVPLTHAPNTVQDSSWNGLQSPERASSVTLVPTLVGDRAVNRISEHSQHAPYVTDNQILSVNISITPEVGALACDEEKAVWFAVTACGTSKPEVNVSISSPLDVVVVLDNSADVSQQCLENACDLANFVAESLNHPADRMAMLCNTYQRADAVSNTGCLLYPLKEIDSELLEKELTVAQEFRCLKNDGKPCLAETIRAACRLLRIHNGSNTTSSWRKGNELTSPRKSVTSDQKHSNQRKGLIVVITPQTAYGLEDDFTTDPFVIHVVQPERFVFQPVNETVPDTQSRSLSKARQRKQGQIRRMLRSTRAGGIHGSVEDLCIEIEPLPGHYIVNTYGQRFCSRLLAGQEVTTMVQIQVPRYAKPKFTKCDSDRAMNDLEVMLGCAVSELFMVRATFKHSSFTSNETILRLESCCLPRLDRSSRWSLEPEVTVQSIASECRLFYCLMDAITESESAETALTILQKIFQSGTYQREILQYFMTICRELEKQVKADKQTGSALSLACHDNSSSPLPFAMSKNESSDLLTTITISEKNEGKNLSGHRVYLSTNTVPPQHIPEALHAIAGKLESFSESSDAAHQIWQNLRQNRKWRRGVKTPMDGPIHENEEEQHFSELRQKALLNKRSIGVDTLRSLSAGANVDVRGNYLPWC